MSVNDIFSKVFTHMIEGTMFHNQMYECYLFLGLKGYAACHKYHYISESIGYCNLRRYFVEKYNDLGFCAAPNSKSIIPDSWYRTSNNDISHQTRKQALMAAFQEWIKWEEATVTLYTSCYKDLEELGEISAAECIKDYLLDADEELTYAKDEMLKKSAMDFDIVSILEEQDTYERQYSKKLKV